MDGTNAPNEISQGSVKRVKGQRKAYWCSLRCRACKCILTSGNRSKSSGICNPCAAQASKKWKEENADKHRKWMSQYASRKREEVIRGYGGCCSGCGENEARFLTIDHVNDDGAEDRRTTKSGVATYLKIIREGYPPRYQVLCASCNQKKRMLYCFSRAPRVVSKGASKEEKKRARVNRSRDKLRGETIEAYGSKCVCCSQDDPLTLTIDHINQDGNRDKGKSYRAGTTLYTKLRKWGWPKDRFRLLCMNCNTSLKWGPCPHENGVPAHRDNLAATQTNTGP